jgi:two-component system NtrC family sensor kinase
MKVETAEHDKRPPKTRNLVLTVMLVAGMPLLFIGFIIIQQFGDVYSDKITDHLTALVKKHSRSIDNFLTDRLGNIRVLARSHAVEDLADKAFLTEKLAILREEYGGVFVDLGLVGPDGIQHAYSGPFSLEKADYSNALWFSQAQEAQFYISDVFTGLRGSPHFIVAVKIPWNNEGWILRATVNFNTFNALVSNIRIGETGFAFIINRTGELQTNPKFEVDSHKGPYEGFLKMDLEPDKVYIKEIPDDLERDSIFAVIPLHNGRWVLFFQQEVSDAFATWNYIKAIATLLFLFWSSIVALFTFFIAKRMVLRIEELLIQKDKMGDQVVEAGRLASIGELAAGIAHEINNPVAIMVEEAGWIQDLLEEDVPASSDNLAEFKRASIHIESQGERCKEITQKLLSFARKTDPTKMHLNLSALITDIIALVDQKTRYANVQIETQLDSSLPQVWASSTELQQVLLNLLNNSVDAMDSSGGRIQITTKLNNQNIVIQIADNGSGIARANLSRIFDPFYTTKPVGKGTGLGLSICYGIIKKMGGDIEVQSEKGEGTTFSIYLPIDKNQTEKIDLNHSLESENP